MNADYPDEIECLKKAAKQSILDYQREFHPLFERLVDAGDGRTEVMDESLYVQDCIIDSDLLGGEAFISFDTYFFSPCKDARSLDDHEVSLPFTIKDSSLVFDIELPARWVPDDDCY